MRAFAFIYKLFTIDKHVSSILVLVLYESVRDIRLQRKTKKGSEQAKCIRCIEWW